MKKILILFLSVLFVFNYVAAQKTNDNGGNSGSNTNNDNNNNNNNSDNSCVSSILNTADVLIGQYQSSLLKSKKKNPSVTSFEIDALGGLASRSGVNFYNILPRLKGNYGAFSGDLRLNHMVYADDPTIKTTGIDGLVEFNIIVGSGFKMAIGQGIYYDFDTEAAFHESLLGVEFGMNERQIIVSPEGRLAYDWSNSLTVFYEVDLTGGYRFVKAGSMNLYVNAGAGYRNFSVSSYMLLYGGISIVIQ